MQHCIGGYAEFLSTKIFWTQLRFSGLCQESWLATKGHFNRILICLMDFWRFSGTVEWHFSPPAGCMVRSQRCLWLWGQRPSRPWCAVPQGPPRLQRPQKDAQLPSSAWCWFLMVCVGLRLTLVALRLLIGELHLVQAAASRVDEEQRCGGLVHGEDAWKIPSAAKQTHFFRFSFAHRKQDIRLRLWLLSHLNKWLSTELWAVSLPWYICSEAHPMMALCMRYWTVSMRTTESPYSWMSRSIRLTERPLDAALRNKNRKSRVSPWEICYKEKVLGRRSHNWWRHDIILFQVEK